MRNCKRRPNQCFPDSVWLLFELLHTVTYPFYAVHYMKKGLSVLFSSKSSIFKNSEAETGPFSLSLQDLKNGRSKK